ncbi:MAG: HAMP domain-containing histidine kinase, partial [Burkholderiaceae bacterium]|nr:HAMP domain-containing histidine kinase [Burkholderiaceae bacterium]
VGTTYNGMLDMQQRHPEDFAVFLRSLLFFEPDSQLYLLRTDGSVIVSTSAKPLPPGYRVTMQPLMDAMGSTPMPYVMGEDPERPGADNGAIIAALPLTSAVIRPDQPIAGYLYLVCQKPIASEGRLEAFRSTFARPALASILAVVVLATLLTAWITATVTRPLRRLTDAVAAVEREGLTAVAADVALTRTPDSFDLYTSRDEFGQLASGFRAMLMTLRAQWEALRRLDHFRREGVSNLSHDLRSPLTATAACLETLDTRWAADPARYPNQAADRQLVEVALRNTRNAARLVQSLGDLAQLDEPEFKLHTELLDAAELLDDIAVRFAARAEQQGVELIAEPAAGDQPTFVAIDIELFERAVANLVDNALKFCPPGGRITLAARGRTDPTPHGGSGPARRLVEVRVSDSGPGIPAADLAHLFDRFYQSRQSVEPASSEGGKGLGLAIVKRIAELHGGSVSVDSELGHGTTVTLSLPAG